MNRANFKSLLLLKLSLRLLAVVCIFRNRYANHVSICSSFKTRPTFERASLDRDSMHTSAPSIHKRQGGFKDESGQDTEDYEDKQDVDKKGKPSSSSYPVHPVLIILEDELGQDKQDYEG